VLLEKTLYLILIEKTMGVLIGYADGDLLAQHGGGVGLVPGYHRHNEIGPYDDV